MAEIVLDNIVFDLQSHGGISSIWETILRGVDKAEGLEARFLQSPAQNDRLPNVLGQASARMIADTGPLLLRRFRSVRVPAGTRVFHSSYFRVTRQAGVKNVVTVHDCIAEKFDKGLRRVLHLGQKSRALRQADVVICVSHYTRADLLSFYPWLDADKVHVVHNGIDLSFFKPGGDVRRRGMLYVGARTAHKNFARALELLATETARSMDLTLDVVGGGAFSHDERTAIKSLGIEHRVIHRGALSRTSLLSAYQSAFALIYPSLYEGFGIPPLEAMACGCPVLCANSASLPEVVGRAAELFDPKSTGDAENALGRLGAVDRYHELQALGRENALRFPQERMVDETIVLYRHLT